jgi:hypothetical protein
MSQEKDYLSDDDDSQVIKDIADQEAQDSRDRQTLAKATATADKAQAEATALQSNEDEAIKFLEVLVPKESLVRKRAFSALLRQIVER